MVEERKEVQCQNCEKNIVLFYLLVNKAANHQAKMECPVCKDPAIVVDTVEQLQQEHAMKKVQLMRVQRLGTASVF